MEKAPRLKKSAARTAGAVAVGLVIGVVGFQAGRDTENPYGTEVKAYNPLTWIASPIASGVEELGIVSTPSKENGYEASK
jgi:hypothetical protein